MSGITRFFVRDVTIHRPLVVSDGYGAGTTLDYDQATTSTARGWLHRLSESELHGATRDANLSTWVLRVPLGTSIRATDRVVIEGMAFDVDGEPNHAWTPEGEHHVRVSLRIIDG